MSATFSKSCVYFIHEPDFSGDVTIQRGKFGEVGDPKITVPFSVLKAFIASAVRKQLISELEAADDDELLGVEQLGTEFEGT